MPFDGKITDFAPVSVPTEPTFDPDAPLISEARVIAWLEKQDPKGRYLYGDINNCCICQYLKSQGLSDPHAGGDYVFYTNRYGIEEKAALPDWIANALTVGTYGGVLAAIREFVAKRSAS